MTEKEKWQEIFITDCEEGLKNIMNDDLRKAFVTMLWYQGYDEAIAELLKNIKDTDTQISYNEENGFSEEVWSVFVLMFGEYGSSPRYGWIDKISEFKSFLKSLLNELSSKDPDYSDSSDD